MFYTKLVTYYLSSLKQDNGLTFSEAQEARHSLPESLVLECLSSYKEALPLAVITPAKVETWFLKGG